MSVAIVSFIAGCFYFGRDDYEDVLKKPSSEWSSRDCLTIVLGVMQHNLFDQATNVTVIATPYYPSVVIAIGRIQQQTKHLSEREFQTQLDTSLLLQSGVYMDWRKTMIVDPRGNYVKDKSQFDSLMFLVTLKNRSWPCAVPLQQVRTSDGGVIMMPLMSMADWPCYIPDIGDLEERIFLSNDRGDTVRPRYVWGRRNSQLTMDETLVAMFPFGSLNGHPFLEDSENIYLIVRGFEKDLKLQFPVSRFR